VLETIVTWSMSMPQQRRIGGGRGAVLTMADQVVSSASNFVVGVLVARAGGASALGTFGIALLIWLTVLGAQRALITEPMTVAGSIDSRDAQLREGMLASLSLSTVTAGVLAAVAGVLLFTGVDALAVLALAPWIPSLLLQDYWRGMTFRLQRAHHALINDVVFAAVQGLVTVALFTLDVENVAAFIASWGVGATAGAVIGLLLAQVRLRPLGRGGVAHLRTLWPRSRWFLAEFSTTFPSDQGYLLLLSALLGTTGFGVYRAGASLFGPVVVIFLTGGNVGLPECVRQLRRHGMSGLTTYTPRLTAAVLTVTTVYCGMVAILAVPILRLVYGEEFAGAVIIVRLLAVQAVVAAAVFGCFVALKAADRLEQLWLMRAATAVVAITSALVLATSFGLTGAGLASVLTIVTYMVGVTVGYRRLLRAGPRAPSLGCCGGILKSCPGGSIRSEELPTSLTDESIKKVIENAGRRFMSRWFPRG
jgi:O-antigen/teichoic acid export membrane protein